MYPIYSIKCYFILLLLKIKCFLFQSSILSVKIKTAFFFIMSLSSPDIYLSIKTNRTEQVNKLAVVNGCCSRPNKRKPNKWLRSVFSWQKDKEFVLKSDAMSQMLKSNNNNAYMLMFSRYNVYHLWEGSMCRLAGCMTHPLYCMTGPLR